VKIEKGNIKNLLKEGKDESARLKVETILKNEDIISAYDIMEVLCEKLQTRLDLITLSEFVLFF
jgi:vacuolar protein sorting-associated protein IST1